MALGRPFAAEEDVPGAAKAVVVSYDFWTRRLGGSPDVIGRTIRLNGVSHTLVGVTAQAFDTRDFGRIDLWVPLQLPATGTDGGAWFQAAARLKPGVSLQQAQAKLAASTASFDRRRRRAQRQRPLRCRAVQGRADRDGVEHAVPQRPAQRAVDALRRSRLRVADRVRERGESHARARERSRARDCSANRARRGTMAHRAPAADRERDLVFGGRRARFGLGLRGHSRAVGCEHGRAVSTRRGRSAARHRLARGRFHGVRVDRDVDSRRAFCPR